MKSRDLTGYFMGLVIFVILIPLIMWRLSWPVHTNAVRVAVFIILAVAGIALSIWSIIYMKNVGKGNPMDAFNHEIGTRTVNLMTEGPYRLCRNPMLLGVFIYYVGLVICLGSWRSFIIFLAFFAAMMAQVHSEEKRLAEDFGEAYLEYKKKTKKLIPFIW